MNFRSFFAKSACNANFNLSNEQIDKFTLYYELLIEWNKKINLTAITDYQDVALKHMIDSLSCYEEKVFPLDCSVIDVGSGAGFPGIPLKIFRPDIRLVLLDSLNKRLLFLQDVCQKVELSSVEFIHSRAEDIGQNIKYREIFDVVVSRAVAKLPVLAELCIPLVKPYGYFLALKGAQYQVESDSAKQAIAILGVELDHTREVMLPGIDDRRAVLYYQKIKNTPKQYPRRPGLPEKKPL